MNKNELAQAIADKANIAKKDVIALLDAFVDVVADELKAGNDVSIANFGKFEIKEKPERQGFNPIKKEAFTIPASKVPVLKFGKAFKDQF